MAEILEEIKSFTPQQKSYFLKQWTKLCAFWDFLFKILGFEDMNNVHKDLCLFLEEKFLFKLILMPRYSFKSSICTIGYSLWQLIKNPNSRILIYSDSASKAEGFLTSIKGHIEGNISKSFFKAVFDWFSKDKNAKWNQSQIIISDRTTQYSEPSVDTGGEGTSFVGKHYNIIIFDDIVSDVNTTTKQQMDKIWDCYKKALSLLVPGGQVIVVGTRWHFGDLYGRIIAENDIKQNFRIFLVDGEKDNKYGEYCFASIGLTKKFLDEQKKNQGTSIYSCNPKGTPILMSDWEYKNIENIEVGDEVVGWSREDKKNNKPRLKKSKVIAIGSRKSEVIKVLFKSGKEIRCTRDHFWYSDIQLRNKKFQSRYSYHPAEIGKSIVYINDLSNIKLSEKDLKDAQWLSGIFDGEGSSDGQTIRIAQDLNHNPEVYNEIERILIKFKFNFGKNKDTFWINGGLQERHRFLLLFNPIRKNPIIKTLWRCDFTKCLDEVIGIYPDGEEEVFSFQTETGNYIAWGYGSRNCLYRNNPVSDETAVFKMGDFAFYGAIKPDDLYITCTCDPAGEGEDFTAITVVGTDNNMDMYILDVINKHLQPSEIVENIINLQYKYRFQILGCETNFFRGMLEAEIRRRRDEEHRSNPEKFTLFGVHEFEASSRHGQGKHARIMALQPFHERKAIKFPGEKFELLQGGFSELAWQMVQYTHDGAKSPHDDAIDSLAYHVPLIRKGGLVKKAELPVNSPAWLEYKKFEKEVEHNMSLPRRLRRQPADLAFS